MDRKILYGGIAGFLAAFTVGSVHKFTGIDLPQLVSDLTIVNGQPYVTAPQCLAGVTLGFAWFIAYVVKPSEWDLIKRLTNDLVIKAAESDDVQKVTINPVVIPPTPPDPPKT